MKSYRAALTSLLTDHPDARLEPGRGDRLMPLNFVSAQVRSGPRQYGWELFSEDGKGGAVSLGYMLTVRRG